MSESYNPLHPTKYPTRWLYGATKCAGAPETWLSIEATGREGQALRRMARLRAFHKGLRLFPREAPEVAKRFEEGYELRFRKIFRYGMWDVQMSLQPCRPDLGEMAEDACK